MSAYLHSAETKLLLQCVKDLERHEGFRPFAYADPLTSLYKKYPATKWGFVPALSFMKPGEDTRKGTPWTYGFGFTHGVTPESTIDRVKATRMLEELILNMSFALSKKIPWYKEASFETKTVLINMGFNLGIEGLLKFRNTLAFLSERKYKQAGSNMRKSLWYKQVGDRAEELSRRIETQSIPAQYKAPESIQ